MTAPVGHNGGPPIDRNSRKRGRPSSYTPELAAIICDRLAVPESTGNFRAVRGARGRVMGFHVETIEGTGNE